MTPLPHVEFGRRRLQVVLQTEAADCALACLAMVCGYYGHRTDVRHLRGRLTLSTRGATLHDVQALANVLHLQSRPLKLELDELSQLQTPCILHWEFNHFVVLAHAGPRRIVIHDPAVGVRRLDYAQASKMFTGVAMEFSPGIEFKPVVTAARISLHSLIGQVQGWWQSLGLVLVMALVLELFALLSPMFNQWVVDEALQSGDRNLLNVLVIGFALLQFTQTAISIARGWTVMYLSTHLNLQWVANAFTHLVKLPLDWFEKRHMGDIVSRFGSIGKIQGTLMQGGIGAALDGLMAVLTLAMMLSYSVKMGFLVIASVLAYMTLRLAAYRPLREASKEALVLGAVEQTCFQETVRGIQAIKLCGAELERRSRWLNAMVDSINRGVRTQKFGLWFGIANTAITSLQSLFVFWIGAHMVLDGAYTVGMLFAFTSYAGQFSRRMAALIDAGVEFRMLGLHCERLSEILLTPIETGAGTTDQPPFANVATLEPTLVLCDVGFRYSDVEPWVLRHINLTIPAGEVAALVGPSGCGKSTLVKLVLGLLQPTEGQITYGGVPLNRLDREGYRKVVGAVMQNDQLFSGSLAENVCSFAPTPDMARILACTRLAAVHDDIHAMPMGYYTLVGDMGGSLSGGQKQRVLLARALYREPRLLVLDEATSHLDVDRERSVNAAVSALAITRICVAHRPETIAMAGRVIRLEQGAVVQDAVQVPVCAGATLGTTPTAG